MEIFCREYLYSKEHVDIKNIHLFRTKLIFSLLKFKGTVSVRLSDPPNKDGNDRFTPKPLKPLSDQ